MKSNIIKGILLFVALFVAGILCGNYVRSSAPIEKSGISKLDSSKIGLSKEDVLRMDDSDIATVREKYLVKMLCDTARAYNIPESVFCGLGYHESARFRVLHSKVKDSNAKFSYGLFQIQLGTAVLYDGSATEEKLLDPTYNLHLAAVIFKKNMEKHGSVEKAIAAHNGCIKDGRITNPNYMKEVYSSIGVVTVKYNL
jgi:soluble lytic murein transglycosylase-like protein